MRRVLLVLMFALLAGREAAAQKLDTSATEHVGSWVISCKVDAMTDVASCQSFLPFADAKGAGFPVGVALFDTHGGFEPVLITTRRDVRSAMLRVDRHPPEFATCESADAAFGCRFRPERLAAIVELLKSGNRAVLRFAYASGDADFAQDLIETEAAMEKFRRLRIAAGQKPGPSARLAAIDDEGERKRRRLEQDIVIGRTICSGPKKAECAQQVERCYRDMPDEAQQLACARKVWAAAPKP